MQWTFLFFYFYYSFETLVAEEKAITKWHVFGRMLMKFVGKEKEGQFDKQLFDHHNVNNCFGENLMICKNSVNVVIRYYFSLFLFLSHQITCSSFFCFATKILVYVFFFLNQRALFSLFFNGTVIQFLFIFELASSSGILNHDAFADVAVEFSLPESCCFHTRVNIETWYYSR